MSFLIAASATECRWKRRSRSHFSNFQLGRKKFNTWHFFNRCCCCLVAKDICDVDCAILTSYWPLWLLTTISAQIPVRLNKKEKEGEERSSSYCHSGQACYEIQNFHHSPPKHLFNLIAMYTSINLGNIVPRWLNWDQHKLDRETRLLTICMCYIFEPVTI